MAVEITPAIILGDEEIQERFVRGAGPGGQNVNKVSTAVELRFDVRGSPSLPDGVRERLERLAGRRLTQEGVLVIQANRFRTQERNRADAMERLAALIIRAQEVPKPRKATRPTAASRQRRLQAKSRRSTVKSLRGAPAPEE